jgi:uncharacterized UPF0146 family protein
MLRAPGPGAGEVDPTARAAAARDVAVRLLGVEVEQAALEGHAVVADDIHPPEVTVVAAVEVP